MQGLIVLISLIIKNINRQFLTDNLGKSDVSFVREIFHDSQHLSKEHGIFATN